jgi:RNase P/RNase MRP subunit POP5
VIIKGLEDSKSNILLEAYELKYKVLKEKAREETSFIAFNILNNGAISIKNIINELRDTK